MLRFQGLALRAFVLLSLFSTGCCCVQSSPCGTGCGPAAWMAHQSCSNGCGEFYVDEWYNHPPQCDPCNACGDYVGGCSHGAGGCSEPACVPLLHRLSCLWGIRYVGHGCEGGCSSCDGGAMLHDGHAVSGGHSGCTSCGGGHASHAAMSEGEVIYDGPVRGSMAPQMAPTPAKSIPSAPQATPSATPSAAPPDSGSTTRSMSPAIRKKSSIQQASAQQPVRRR